MEIGNELSEKIRSAIKAKLVDLGAYVDDELPDYIMVMVANKKTQDQMTEDLNLFLGSNTEKFTSWLSALLAKLKAVTLAGEAEKDNANSVEKQGSKAKSKSSTVKAASPRPEEELEPDITIIPERDEFEEEERLEKKKAAIAAQSQVAKPTPGEPLKTKKTSAVAVKQPKEKTTSPPSTSIKARLGIKVSPKSSSSSASKYSSLASDISATRKRRVPGSVVGSVLKKDVDQEEEEYDPHKPMIGKVASTIRVGNRRSSVPLSHQASKSLVMKAVTEARDSVEQRVPSSKMVSDQMSRPIHRRLGELPKQSRQTSRSSSSRAPGSVTSRQPERSVELFTRSKREENIQRIKSSSPESEENNGHIEYQEEERDTRQIKYESTEVEEAEVDADEEEVRHITVKADENSAYPTVETLIQSGAEESDFTDEETSQPRTVTRLNPEAERPPSPKFVVTLDGVDPSLVTKAMKSDNEMDVDDQSTIIIHKYPQVDEVSIRLDEEDDEDDEDESGPLKRTKTSERCRFWPACKMGNECEYHHPTVACNMFPRCKFGDKCLYIHPNCKFDANCTRPKCPYTHASQRSSSTPYPVVIQPVKILPVAKPSAFIAATTRLSTQIKSNAETKCRFYPKCTNMNCAFYHPKPCRYGISCMNKVNCPFSHPALPSKAELKWMPPRQPNVMIQLDDKAEEY